MTYEGFDALSLNVLLEKTCEYFGISTYKTL